MGRPQYMLSEPHCVLNRCLSVSLCVGKWGASNKISCYFTAAITTPHNFSINSISPLLQSSTDIVMVTGLAAGWVRDQTLIVRYIPRFQHRSIYVRTRTYVCVFTCCSFINDVITMTSFGYTDFHAFAQALRTIPNLLCCPLFIHI